MASDVAQPHLQKMLDKSQERKRIFNDYLTNDQENNDTFEASDPSIEQLKITDGLYKTETQKEPVPINEMEYFDAKRNEIYKKREEILSRKHVPKEEPKKVVKP